MLVIYGKKNARIKKCTDHQNACFSCKSFDINVKVFVEYFHTYWIPVYPFRSLKTATLSCNNCGARISNRVLEEQYETRSRIPFYLYTLPILLTIATISLIISASNFQKKKEMLAQDPKVGDIYHVNKQIGDSSYYYFLRLSYISGDTVYAEHGKYTYSTHLSEMPATDTFDREDLLILDRKEIKSMAQKGEIIEITR